MGRPRKYASLEEKHTATVEYQREYRKRLTVHDKIRYNLRRSERYHSDPVYRDKCRERARKYYRIKNGKETEEQKDN